MSPVMTSLKEQGWVSVVMSVWKNEQRDFWLSQNAECLSYLLLWLDVSAHCTGRVG